MSAYDPTAAFTVPGRFVIGPSQGGMSTGVYPYGGAPVGICSKAKLVREQVYAYSNSEALGRDSVGAYGGRFKAALAAVLVQYDRTILNKLYAFSATSTGGYQDANVLSLPLPGRSLAPGIVTAGSPLLFVADDYLNLPSVLIYAPIYLLQPKLELDFTLDKPLETAFVVLVGLDATNRDLACDLLGNLAA